jgi:predicted nucleic acid-binding protein
VSVGRAPGAVLDTNVLLDLLLFDDPSTRPLRAAIEAAALRPLRSADCDAEFAEVLARAQFGLDEASRRRILERWAGCSEPIAEVASLGGRQVLIEDHEVHVVLEGSHHQILEPP